MKNNIAELGKNTRFSSEYQPENRRKKCRIAIEAKNVHLSITDQVKIFTTILSSTEEELMQIVKDKSKSMAYRNMAKVFLNDFSKNKLSSISYMLNRVFGKAAQSIKIKGSIEHEFSTELLTEEEKNMSIRELIAVYNKHEKAIEEAHAEMEKKELEEEFENELLEGMEE